MFNISFGEIIVVAVVGLIIIGPKRLPQTARFVGHLVSRVQRQAAEVKADIRREMDLEDLKNIQREYESAARGVGDDFRKHEREIRDSVSIANPAASDSAAEEKTTAAAFNSNVEKTTLAASDSSSAENSAAANDSNSTAAPKTPWPNLESAQNDSAKNARGENDSKQISANEDSAAADAVQSDARQKTVAGEKR